jgi:16S rRNA (uracil1498-N3)-methyltransferase
MQNFYSPHELFDGLTVALAEDEYHHAVRTCRVRIGETIGVTDGCGRRVEARIETIDRNMLVARVTRDVSGCGESRTALALALVKPARFE